MAIALRLRSSRTTPPPASPIVVRRVSDPLTMALIQGKPEGEMRRRFHEGHRAYVAYMDDAPAAFGWVATRVAEIGELKRRFEIPVRARYLWNFVTVKAFRGRGIYPRLLDAIVEMENDADAFWIAYAPENRASASGIAKAGFRGVAELSFDSAERPRVRAMGENVPIVAAAELVGVPMASEELTPCWKCVRAGRGAMACKEGECQCDYQRPETECH